MNNVELKKMTATAIFIAIGVILAPFVSFPFGGAPGLSPCSTSSTSS